MVYSNTAVYMGENEYGKSGHLSMFTALKHLKETSGRFVDFPI